MIKSIHKGMMTEDILSVENGKVAKKKSCHSIGSCLYGFFKRFAVSGERRVWRQQMTKEDFELPEDFKIAKYDADLVAKFWNNRNRRRSILKVIGKLFVEGIISKLVPIVFLYLVLYYTLNPFYFNATLCKTTNQNDEGGNQQKDPNWIRLSLSGGRLCNKANFETWIALEREYTKILTFFIGFIVSLSVKAWFEKVSTVPQLDHILIHINNFLWVDPTQNVDEVMIKENITVKQFRETIIRYFLLSWSMCLSRMSDDLNEKFRNPLALNEKRLMLKGEYEKLRSPNGRDIWREKWSTPLSWVAKIVNDINVKDVKKEKDEKSVKVLDIKDAIGKTLTAYCKDLQKLNSYNEYRLPTPLITLLTIAMYALLIINIASGQDMYPSQITYLQFIFDFPIDSICKYLLLFGWLRVATDLMFPFGKGKERQVIF